MRFSKQIYALVEKDIIAELRSKEILNAMVIFVIITFVILSFGLSDILKANLKVDLEAVLLAGILWLAFAFAAVLGLNRSFVHEKDEGCMDGLLLAPLDRSLIFFAKFISNLIFLLTVQFISIFVFAVFFLKDGFYQKFWILIAAIILGDLGISAVGTLLSAIAVNGKARDLLLPILFFPMIIPVYLSLIPLTKYAFLSTAKLADVSGLMQFLAVYDIVFLVVPFIVFDFIVED
ncbi:MAG: hypothetical protein C4562_05975 [Actinobacteria bacterium]|nr:MAG: hypothetical protein C4562_05975 [Actinomycetota bacterium]